MNPNFDQYGTLRVTGVLTLDMTTVHLEQHPAIIRMKALAVDEIGAYWDVATPNFPSSMNCERYPASLRGTYHLKEAEAKFRSTYRVQASSFDEAVALLRAERSWYKDKQYELERVTAPKDGPIIE